METNTRRQVVLTFVISTLLLVVIALIAALLLALNSAQPAGALDVPSSPPTMQVVHPTPESSLTLQATESMSANVEFISQLGGEMDAVAVQGKYAYVGIGPSLAVLDISDQAHSTAVGKTIPTPGAVRRMVVSGTHAYVAKGHGGLHVVDVSDPANPRGVGSYSAGTYASGVAITGHYVYLTDEHFGVLHIVDVSNPVSPQEVGLYTVLAGPQNVAVVGDYAYVADGWGGLRVLDISDPALPRQVGAYGSSSGGDLYATDVKVVGSYAYVANGFMDRAGLRIINISDPAHPALVSRVSEAGFAFQVAVANNYAYLISYNTYSDTSDLTIIDVAQPITPSVTAVYSAPEWFQDISVADNTVYLAGRTSGLHIINVSNLATPHKVGAYETPLVQPRGVAISGTGAYIADNTLGNGLRVINISDPKHPTLVSAYGISQATDVAVSGTYAYVAAGEGLHIISVLSLTNPIEVGSVSIPGAMAVTVAGRYAYIGDSSGGLQIVDIRNPTAPVEVGHYATGWSLDPQSIAVSGNYVYAADWYDGLRILDVSNPAHPTQIGSWPGVASGVAVSGNMAYVTVGLDGGLHILNISDPTHPTEIGFLAAPGRGGNVAVTPDGYVYITIPGTLCVINVSDPAHPTEIGYYQLPSVYVYDIVATDEGYIYVAGEDAGLTILRFQPHPPQADFIASPTSGTHPLTVVFTDTSTNLPNTWLWTFGDGDTSLLPNPVHTYTVAGIYTVSLHVSNLFGSDTLTRTNYITVSPPQADFTATPTKGLAPLTVTFTNQSSGDYVSSLWDFSDGLTSTLPSPTHTFAAGVYTVTLTVSGPGGASTLTRSDYIQTYLPQPAFATPICGTTNNVSPTLSGLAPHGFVITLYDNGAVLLTTTTTLSDTFMLTPTLPTGQHVLTATATNAAGAGLPSHPLTLTVNPALPYDPVGVTFAYAAPGGLVTGHPRDSAGCANSAWTFGTLLPPDHGDLWRVWLRSGYTTTLAVPVSYTSSAIVTVTLGDQTRVVADLLGTLYLPFAATFTPPLSPGVFAITVTADGQTVFASGSTLIDPDGYVFDRNVWESQGITQTLAGVSVTCEYSDTAAHEWVMWNAGAYDQVNPQVTSADGYYSFFVPAGIYRITASRQPDRWPFTSTDLHVVNTPARLNIPLALVRRLYVPMFASSAP